jgi:5-dehydro-2-deoxygluconokinase
VDFCILGRIGYDLYSTQPNRPLPEVETFSRHLGGSSANIAVGLARLSLEVSIIGCIGDDLLAPFLLGFLHDEHVDAQQVRRVQGYNTSLCLTEITPPDRFPQVFYRANPADLQLKTDDNDLAYVRQAKNFLTNGTALAASPSHESALSALQTAHAAGLRTIFDVDYRASSWPSPAAAGAAAREVLPLLKVVLANETELELLTGSGNREKSAAMVMNAGVEVLVCKLGSSGVVAYTRDGVAQAEPCPVEVVSTIGAGDGFAAGFLYALHKQLPVEAALAYGNAAAAVVVNRVSCSDAMPYLYELEAHLPARLRPAQVAARAIDSRRANS